jgi:Alkylmercury lyase
MNHYESKPTDQAIGATHAAIIQKLLATGRCPSRFELAGDLKTTETDVAARLLRLAEIHGVVLHPHEPECWVIHPFSTLPTLHWVDAGTRSWWAPCIWCALGIATLAKEPVQIHSRIGAEGKSVVLDVEDGHPSSDADDLVVHFSIPPRRAWENVHQHCALVLPFQSATEAVRWCETHGQRHGEIVPMRNVAHMARLWYGTHANADWRKWTVPQAQDIFRAAGLTSAFWQLEGAGTY